MLYYDEIFDFNGNSYSFNVNIDNNCENFLVWDKKRFNFDVFDLKDFANFFKIKNFYDLKDYFPKKYDFFKKSENKLLSWLKTYDCIGSKHEYRSLPQFIYKDFLSARADLMMSLYDYIKNIDMYSSFKKYYEHNRHIFMIQKEMDYKIKTTDGYEKVELEFAENFRFKNAPETLNLFHMPKVLRKKIIPQDNDSFIFSADYRQFEFRTFLKLIDFDIDFENENLYEELGNSLNLTQEDFKIKLISFIYSNSDELKIFDKNKILEKIQNDYFIWNNIPVFVGKNEQKKQIHTIIQTISYFYYLDKLNEIIKMLKNKKSKFLFPLHDEIIFSIHKNEIELLEEIPKILSNEVYKVKKSVGNNLGEMKILS